MKNEKERRSRKIRGAKDKEIKARRNKFEQSLLCRRPQSTVEE
jgi:hypothetical protein